MGIATLQEQIQFNQALSDAFGTGYYDRVRRNMRMLADAVVQRYANAALDMSRGTYFDDQNQPIWGIGEADIRIANEILAERGYQLPTR